MPAERGRPEPREGVDWGQFRALFAAGLKLDLRMSHGVRRGRTRMPPMIIALITYTVMGTVLGFALAMTGEPFVFTLFTLSASMFMVSLSVIMEYSAVVVHPDDYDIMAHRPISSRTYFWTKAANLGFYVSATAAALGLPSAIVGAVTFDAGVLFGIAYFVAILVACLATAALIVLLYTTALKIFDYQRFTNAITYVHSLSTLALTLGYVLLPRMLAEDVTLLHVERGRWVFAAPPAWFAGAVELAIGRGGPQSIILAALAAASSAVLITLAMSVISLDYSRRISELAAAAPDPVRDSLRPERARGYSRFGLRLCHSDEERAGFQLMLNYMRRDRKLRTRVYPAFGLPLAVYVYGIVSGNLADPFSTQAMTGSGGFPVEELLGFYSVFITLFFASALTQTDQWRASWIFFAAPVERRADLVAGARKLVVWRYLLPFYVILFVLLSFAIPPLSAGLYLLITFLLALVSFALLSLASPYLPLSQAIEKTRQARQIALIMLLGLAMGVLVAVQETIREAHWMIPFVLMLLLGLVTLAEWALRKRLERKLATQEFPG